MSTIADGIAVKEPGEHTFDLCSKYVDGIVTVTEDEICAAILALMEQQKLIAEGAGAVAVAARLGGNIISVLHERNNNNSNVTACFLRLVMETRNAEHISLIRNALLEAGYTIVN